MVWLRYPPHPCSSTQLLTRDPWRADVEITDIKELEDLVEYVSHGITWEEFNEAQAREKARQERREAQLRRIREVKRAAAEREAKQVEENEFEYALCHAARSHLRLIESSCCRYTFWGDRLKLELQAGDDEKNAVVTGFVNKATMLRCVCA